MSANPTDLDALRREIDQLDDRMHDLLMQRAEAVGRVPQVKNGTGPFLRPGREAQILRRLVGRHRGPLPLPALARICRELISSLYRLQGPLRVAVHAPEKSVGYWDLARSHFGAATQMTLHRSPHAVLRAVAESDTTLGILSLPQEGEAAPWWPQLAATGPAIPRIVVRLPFVDDSEGRLENLNALVVARMAPEESGDDISLIVLTTLTDGVSRARIAELLAEARLPGQVAAAQVSGEQRMLIEVPGFVSDSDERLPALIKASRGTVLRAVPIGAYARPVAPAT